jgi:hypothetical protein
MHGHRNLKPLITFFLTTSENLHRYKSVKRDAISFLRDSFPGNFPTINIIPITEAETKSIISSLKPKNTSGYNEITSKIMCFIDQYPIKLYL